jgi:hypothetical protein
MRIVLRLASPSLASVLLAMTLALAACAKPASEPAAHPATASISPPASKVGGCRDLYLYAASDDSTQVVIVDVDAKAVGLEKGQTKTFDLTSAPKGVRVWLDVYLQPAHVENVHCTKAPTEPQMAERYAATAGTLVVQRSADGTVTATIDGAKFALDGRPTIEIATRRFDRIRVGWLPG